VSADETVAAVRGALSDDLRRPKYRGEPNRYKGHCYVASEAIFHLLGGKPAGYQPMRVRHEDDSHWFLTGPDGAVIDATAEQFSTPVPYGSARRAAFLTQRPSARAVTLMSRARSTVEPASSAVSRSPALLVAPCSFKAADTAVKRWHYSRSMPTPPRVLFGVWEHGRFAGVIIFSRGGSPNLGKPYGLKLTELCELTRIAMREHTVPVSQCVAVALKLLKQQSPGLRLCVSFADPDHDHHGGIYQAGNWLYLGLTNGETQYVVNGRQYHSRSLASTQYGTGRRTKRAMSYLREHFDPDARTVKLPGKHRYAMPFDRAMRRQLRDRVQPYPARADEGSTGASASPGPRGGFDPRSRLDDQPVVSDAGE